RALRTKKCELVLIVDPIAKHVDQRRIIDRKSVSRWCLYIKHQIRRIGVNWSLFGPDALRFSQIDRCCCFIRVTKSGPKSQHLALVASGEVGKSLRAGRTSEGKEGVAV